LDRRTKEKVVVELHELLKGTKLAVLAGYTGMNVEKMNVLRNNLRKSGTEFRVLKNTLFEIASRGTDFSKFEEYIKGPLAIALNRGDVVGPAKLLVEFAKKNAELEIIAGILDGKLISKQQISALAELPSKEVLVGKLLSVMVGVQASLVNVLSGVPRSFICALNAYRTKKESGN
jgi:large subunit ribosomal protein L10